MINYAIDPEILRSFVPDGTVLDSWNGRTYVSLVGFLFLDTKVRGISIPFHRNFEEVNLRFYVRRDAPEGPRRAVVFIKEIVPRAAIAGLARLLYGENYVALQMRHELALLNDGPVPGSTLAYEWKFRGRWQRIAARFGEGPRPIVPGSEAEFITEHYWGYSTHRRGTVEYEVGHPQWLTWSAEDVTVDCDVANLYGPQFAPWLSKEPTSAFIANGSEIIVKSGRSIGITAR